jgi:hypothetical protein
MGYSVSRDRRLLWGKLQEAFPGSQNKGSLRRHQLREKVVYFHILFFKSQNKYME